MPDAAAAASVVAAARGFAPGARLGGTATGASPLASVVGEGAPAAVVAVILVFAAAVGASIGSFLAVVIERVPRGEGIGGRSHCACGRTLAWYENLPMVSWLLLRGRARCCGAPIPAWYLVLEVCCALVAVAAVLAPGPAWLGPLGGVAVLAAVGAAGVTRGGARRSRL